MLQPESPSYPHTLAQWLYIVLAWFLGAGGAAAWYTEWRRRKHGPAEVRKIDAETRSIIIRDDIALGDSVGRLIKEVSQAAQDAEQRRQNWLLQEEQLRSQILFWRQRAEEYDGELIDSRDANAQLKARLKVKQNALDRAVILLKTHKVSFSEADEPEVKKLLDWYWKHVEELEQSSDTPRE